ncbi:hypothetical protein ABIB85_004462 [Bradyrhizobium sp. JR1.5]|uniref:hypothetical protein n=1 Tax=unclassified Bradyrhizobium TaxID=2631580 RepID=UPI0033955ADD
MAKTGAQRQQERRERKGRGKRLVPVEVGAGEIVLDRGMIADALVDANLLPEWSTEDSEAVRNAFADALHRHARRISQTNFAR